jgi:DNA-binding transcriptional LysR family regulator
MNLSAVRTFLDVVETGNLNKAAERLNVTPSTVSARLDSLEETLGQALLVRSRRGARMTLAGYAFRPHAELLLRGWEQARAAVGLPKGFSSRFSFACQFDLWDGAGEPWLTAVRAANPDLAYEVWPAAISEIKSWLASGLSDVAITTEPVTGQGVATREFARQALVQVSTVPRAARQWDSGNVFVDLGSDFRRQHSLAWSTDETAAMSFAASNWALEYLREKGGSAYLPRSLVDGDLVAGTLHLVEGSPTFERPLFLAWRDASIALYDWIDDPGYWTGID